jgi:hypothetical protein
VVILNGGGVNKVLINEKRGIGVKVETKGLPGTLLLPGNNPVSWLF